MADVGLVQKTVQIVRAVAASPEGIGLSELARETGLPKATCHRILSTLVSEGWLSSNPDTKRFRTSLSLLLMLSQGADQEGARRFVDEVLERLAAATAETAGLDQLVGSSIMVLSQAIGPHIVTHAQRAVPRTLPSWRTSSGKAFLAFADPIVVRAEFESDPEVARAGVYEDFVAFETDLAAIRERGYSFVVDELEPGAAAVAAPVKVGERVPYVVWVGGPSYRLTRDRIPEVAEHVACAAGELSEMFRRLPGGVAFGVPEPIAG